MPRTTRAATTAKSRTKGQKVARLYHFESQTIEHIEFLAGVFGGKEKGIAAAIEIAASALRGEGSELQITLK
jgi:hypothetical protein